MESNKFLANLAIHIGPFVINSTLITTWILTLILVLLSWLITRNMQLMPGRAQSMLEAIVEAIVNSIAGIQTELGRELLPLIGTIWIFIAVANLIGLIPGLQSPTEDLSTTSALALIVFFSVHWYGIKISGFKAYIKHYLSPSPIMLPFHLISEISRTLALAIRLFGNIMSLDMAAALVLMVAGFLAPVPILMLHIVEALVQAYIFGILALIYIASGISIQQIKQTSQIGASND